MTSPSPDQTLRISFRLSIHTSPEPSREKRDIGLEHDSDNQTKPSITLPTQAKGRIVPSVEGVSKA